MRKFLLSCMVALSIGATAQITLGTGTTKGPAPVSTYYEYSYVQQIFPKSEINADAAGNITGLKFYLSSTATITNSSEWVVYLGHTAKSNFTSVSDWIPLSGLTKVFEGTVTNNGGLVEIGFATPFPYNNADNLVIAAEENKPGYNSNGSAEAMYVYAGSSNNTLYFRDDTVNPDPTGTLPDGARTANKSIVTFLGLTPSAIPACPTVTAPTATATGVAVSPTITWNAVNGATGYRISMGTTPGGTNILNNQDLGNVTTYALTTSLQYSTQYYYTITAYNGGVSSTGCTENSFTTRAIPCPTITAPQASASGVSTTPTITWDVVTAATGYKLSVGTTAGGTDVLNNQDLGNVTSYTFPTALNTATTYFYTVNSYNATSNSASCSERSFATVCGGTNIPYTQDFESATTPSIPMCTSRENVGSGNNWTTYSPGTGSFNTKALNYTYHSTNAANAWFFTQGLNLTAGTTYRLSFIYGNASGISFPEKLKVAYGTTAASSSMNNDLLDFSNITNGTTANAALVDFTPPTSGVYYIGFNAYSAANMNRLYVDNIKVDVAPACSEPLSFVATPVTSTSATITWVAPSAAPANGYEYVFSTTNTTPTSGTPIAGTSVNLPPLTPNTTYYAWVRSMCAGTQSVWSSVSFTTLPTPPSNDECSNVSTLTPGGTFVQNAIVGTTIGATNTGGHVASCLNTPTNVGGNVWYKVIVPASGSLTIETDTNTGTTLTDTVVSVFADCTSTTSIACDDDSGTGSFSKISLTNQTPGTVLYISVSRYSNAGGGTDGSFMISAYDASLILATSEVSRKENGIKVYPNPFVNEVTISDIANVNKVLVNDISGKLIKTINTLESATLRLGELKSGAYLLTLEMKDGTTQTIKVLKK
ncbi:fibronectin type III domain-containing protein [Chryseobacterium potabilaquae]|uniref:Fibronectin type-III domain-containing protein n=1 Tax=Chryseobacterium potabilaquae TaxID=2675057 RepID=A0A6N4X0I9_9FLAO|nr:fibronectin type III domain-containing protein [Chryseobacterium potabilaquae]CAA7193687.1 hypothetical protein CHRY9293_00099 [Chryseobacterium potabilaquae]